MKDKYQQILQDFINAKDFDHIYKYFIQFLRDKNTGNLVVFDSSVDKLDPKSFMIDLSM